MDNQSQKFVPSPSHAESQGFPVINWREAIKAAYDSLPDKTAKNVNIFDSYMAMRVSDYSTCAVGQLDARIPRRTNPDGRDASPADAELWNLGLNFYGLTVGMLHTRQTNSMGGRVNIRELSVHQRYDLAVLTLDAIEARGEAILKELE